MNWLTTRLVLASPLTEEMLAPYCDETDSVQLKEPLTEAEYRRVGAMMAGRPYSLSIHSDYASPFQDFEFLRHFEGVRTFTFFALFGLRDVGGLRYLAPALEGLVFGSVVRRNLSLDVLRHLTRLHTLEIEGHSRDSEAIGDLHGLRDLTLRSVTLPDLAALKPLINLESLDLKLGGTRDLRLLPEIGRLTYFEAWMIKGLSDISAVGDVTTLQYLFLQALKQVTALPDLSRLRSLRRVHLETMKGLRDLRPLLSAPALEEIDLVDMRHLQPEDVACLAAHPALRRLNAGLGSKRKNLAVEAFVPGVSRELEKFEFR